MQSAVDTQHHLIVAQEMSHVGSDRDRLSSMAKQAREAMAPETMPGMRAEVAVQTEFGTTGSTLGT